MSTKARSPPDCLEILAECIAAGTDQIIANDPPGRCRLWRYLA
jgi:hypothetical protein